MTSYSPSKKEPWNFSPFSQLPSAVPSYFPGSHWRSEISSLSKAVSVLGKVRSFRVPNLGYRGAEPPEWFDISPKNSAWDMMLEWVHCCDEAANHQLAIAVAFWIIWIVSVEKSNLIQNVMQIHCSTHSAILNPIDPQYTRSLNGIYLPTDQYSEVVIVHACAFQSTLLGCQVTLMPHKPFSSY